MLVPAVAAGSSLVVVDDALGTRRILDPGVSTCLWRRDLGVAWRERFAAFTAAATSFESRFVVDADETELPAVDAALATALMGESRDFVLRDVRRLLWLFVSLAGPRRVRVSLSLIVDDSCRRFHTDDLGLRLLCTYAGPGTECVPDVAADREAMRSAYSSPEIANAAIVKSARFIRRAAPGHIVLLKGDAWPGNHGRGAVHRSPPIEATGERRLVLVMNGPLART